VPEVGIDGLSVVDGAAELLRDQIALPSWRADGKLSEDSYHAIAIAR
jgi:hypothetical protein